MLTSILSIKTALRVADPNMSSNKPFQNTRNPHKEPVQSRQLCFLVQPSLPFTTSLFFTGPTHTVLTDLVIPLSIKARINQALQCILSGTYCRNSGFEPCSLSLRKRCRSRNRLVQLNVFPEHCCITLPAQIVLCQIWVVLRLFLLNRYIYTKITVPS